jgi:acetyltransferase
MPPPMPSQPHPLEKLFNPRGVAVIGASQSPGKYGTIILKSLIEEGYPGRIYPVNPKGGALLGHEFLTSLEAADGSIDVALIVRPASGVMAVLEEVIHRRIPFAIVYAAGFAEHGEEGRALQQQMVEKARAAGTRIVGPNCMNISSLPARLNLSAIVPFPVGGLGFLSASGNLGFSLAQEARHGHVGFSRFVSAGNQADLALDEYLDYFRQDPHTQVILIYTEGVVRGRGRLLLEGIERAAAEKPVLALRGGRTREGSGAALSHTGALSGEAEVANQAFEQAGAVLVDREDECLSIAQAFLRSPLPRGDKVAIVGEGGGHATLSTDAASEAGLTVLPFPEPLVRELRRHIPDFTAIVHNPIELGGQSEYDYRAYERVLGPVLEWDGCDLVVMFGGYSFYDEQLAEFLDRSRKETGKPIVVHDLYAEEDRPGVEYLRKRNLPLYSSTDLAVRSAAALARATKARKRARRGMSWRREGENKDSALDVPADLAEALERAGRSPERALTEDEATRLLSHFGMPALPSALARGEVEAVREAERMGYPVALKIHEASIVHKTDAGGVHLDLRSAADVRRAYGALCGLVKGGEPEVRLTPFLTGGVEAITGARRDREYGPILLFGAGGILAELVRDVAIRMLPCPRAEIEEMVAQTRVGRLLAGVRGAPPVDTALVVQALEAVGRLLMSVPQVTDVEVNPLRCSAERVAALDARILVGA